MLIYRQVSCFFSRPKARVEISSTYMRNIWIECIALQDLMPPMLQPQEQMWQWVPQGPTASAARGKTNAPRRMSPTARVRAYTTCLHLSEIAPEKHGMYVWHFSAMRHLVTSCHISSFPHPMFSACVCVTWYYACLHDKDTIRCI